MSYWDVTLRDSYKLRQSVSQNSQNISKNTSSIKATLQLIKGSGSGKWAQGPHPWSITINGSKKSGSLSSYDFRKYSTLTMYSSNITISHNSNGTKAFHTSSTYKESGWGELASGSIGNKSFTCTTIPRASKPTVSPTSQYAASYITISTHRASGSFKHATSIKLGGKTITISSSSESRGDWSWQIPWALLEGIPNNTSGTATITMDTYSGSTKVGTNKVNMTIKVPTSAIPVVGVISQEEANPAVVAVLGPTNNRVQRVSKMDVSIATSGSSGIYGSTIKSYELTFESTRIMGRTGQTDVIAWSGPRLLVGKVTDSRGRVGIRILTVNVLQYSPPTIEYVTFVRATGGVPDSVGTQLLASGISEATSLPDGVSESNSLHWRIETKLRTEDDNQWVVKKADTSIAIASTSISGVGSETISKAESRDARLVLTDAFSTIYSEGVISTADVFMHWGDNGLGVGKYHEIADPGTLDVYGQIYQNDGQPVLSGSILGNSNWIDVTAEDGFSTGSGWVVRRMNARMHTNILIELETLFTRTGAKITSSSDGNISDSTVAMVPVKYRPVNNDRVPWTGQRDGYQPITGRIYSGGEFQIVGTTYGADINVGDMFIMQFVYST